MENTLRVYCLYRVSTVVQVEKNDIPMQREFCRAFVDSHPGWQIEKELYEKGVSGFKKSAKERDAIQEIQRDAVQGKFDILLVYMFDRLGRKDDETPFIVEWFVRNGIEVWSATEGEQRFDNHVDKLLNYIRYWQASGESIKTSVRTKTRLEQLTESGFYTGGSVAYGYRLDKRGRTNKRNKEVYDLAIDEDAAKIIQLIFHKYVYEGFGAQRLSKYLTEMNIRKPNGKNFPNTSINRIIKNPIYTGIIRNGEVQSEIIPELQIIDQDTFDRAQKTMSDRTTHHAETPLNLKGQSLLVGNIFCGHCRNRLTLTTGGRNRVRKDGSIYHDVRARYQCHYNVRHPGECDGQSGYGVKKLDGIVDRIVRYQLSKISTASGEDIVAKQNQKAIDLAKAKHHMATIQLADKKKELVDYQNEGIKVIRGQSKFDMDFLNELVNKVKTEIQELEATVKAAREELDAHIANADVERKEYEKIKTWADLYDGCTFAAKKMIISQFIKSVYVYRDYTLEIEFNVSFEEFQTMATECRDQGANEQPLVYITA